MRADNLPIALTSEQLAEVERDPRIASLVAMKGKITSSEDLKMITTEIQSTRQRVRTALLRETRKSELAQQQLAVFNDEPMNPSPIASTSSACLPRVAPLAPSGRSAPQDLQVDNEEEDWAAEEIDNEENFWTPGEVEIGPGEEVAKAVEADIFRMLLVAGRQEAPSGEGPNSKDSLHAILFQLDKNDNPPGKVVQAMLSPSSHNSRKYMIELHCSNRRP